MSKSSKRMIICLSLLVLAMLSCGGPLNYIMAERAPGGPRIIHLGPDALNESDVSDQNQKEVVPQSSDHQKSTLETSEIQGVSTPVLTSGACAWVLTADSDGYPSGEVKEGMRVGEGDIKTSLRTYFSHGKSECGEQIFETYHAWYLDDIYYPGKTVNFSVVFGWNNIGTADCASLAMAGGSTALSVGNFQIKAQNSNINIRTAPQGELSDSDTWVVPEGDVGDVLTITQNVSTGIYGKNIRWRYEYVCD